MFRTSPTGADELKEVQHYRWWASDLVRVRNLNINPCGMWALSWQGDKLVRTPTALVNWYRP